MARKDYQAQSQPFPQPDPLEVEAQRIRATTGTTDNARVSKPLNSDLDGHVPGKINQADCIERLRAAGLLSGFETYEACGSPLAERILRAALGIDSQTPIPKEFLGDLWLMYMHEPVTEGSKILSNAVIGYSNRNHVDLPRPGISAVGHQVTFRDEMSRRCS